MIEADPDMTLNEVKDVVGKKMRIDFKSNMYAFCAYNPNQPQRVN
jgi:hypothetical protein